MSEFVELNGQDVECRVCGDTIAATPAAIEDHMATHRPSEVEHAAVEPIADS